jgi:hypothetical protein
LEAAPSGISISYGSIGGYHSERSLRGEESQRCWHGFHLSGMSVLSTFQVQIDPPNGRPGFYGFIDAFAIELRGILAIRLGRQK